MGSQVSVVVAEIVFQNIEEQALATYTLTIPLWLLYVDGTVTTIFTNTLTDRTRTYSLPRGSRKMTKYLF